VDLSKAFSMIKQYEGLRLKAYPDPASGGVPWTIGYGTTDINGLPVRSGMVCMPEQALAWMESDASKMATKIQGWLERTVTDNEMSALISLAYNIGLGGLYHSQVLADINDGLAPKVCADAFMHFIHAAGKINQGLINRRKEEMAVFLS